MSSLVEENKYSDLLVVCGNDQYPCHRAVVCMRSTYFRSRCEEVEKEWKLVRDHSSLLILVVTSDLATAASNHRSWSGRRIHSCHRRSDDLPLHARLFAVESGTYIPPTSRDANNVVSGGRRQ